MAVNVPTKLDVASGLVLNVGSWPESDGDVSFDSFLIRHNDGA
jgi:hypothetical protein